MGTERVGMQWLGAPAVAVKKLSECRGCGMMRAAAENAKPKFVQGHRISSGVQEES